MGIRLEGDVFWVNVFVWVICWGALFGSFILGRFGKVRSTARRSSTSLGSKLDPVCYNFGAVFLFTRALVIPTSGLHTALPNYRFALLLLLCACFCLFAKYNYVVILDIFPLVAVFILPHSICGNSHGGNWSTGWQRTQLWVTSKVAYNYRFIKVHLLWLC